MHFLFNLLRIKGFYMSRALLAHLQETLNKWSWYTACMLCQLAAPDAIHNTHTHYRCDLQSLYVFFVKESRSKIDNSNYCRTSVHERLSSRTNRFTNKFSEQKTSRVTNGVLNNEHAGRQQRLATSWEYRRESVSCCVSFTQYKFLARIRCEFSWISLCSKQ
jgi:hypothetical protein